MLTEHLDAVIGVDTHKRTHTAAAVASTGAVPLPFQALSAGARPLPWAPAHHLGCPLRCPNYHLDGDFAYYQGRAYGPPTVTAFSPPSASPGR